MCGLQVTGTCSRHVIRRPHTTSPSLTTATSASSRWPYSAPRSASLCSATSTSGYLTTIRTSAGEVPAGGTAFDTTSHSTTASLRYHIHVSAASIAESVKHRSCVCLSVRLSVRFWHWSLFLAFLFLQPFFFFFWTDYKIPQTFTVTSSHIRFYFLVFLFYNNNNNNNKQTCIAPQGRNFRRAF